MFFFPVLIIRAIYLKICRRAFYVIESFSFKLSMWSEHFLCPARRGWMVRGMVHVNIGPEASGVGVGVGPAGAVAALTSGPS